MIKTVLIYLLSLYQKFISPFFGSRCRFAPSCSEYAKIAIREKGILKGAGLAVVRISKCHPLHEGGYDPVV